MAGILDAAPPQTPIPVLGPIKPTPLPPIVQQMYQQYPWSQNIPANYVDETASGDPLKAGRKLEFYMPNDAQNPQPGKPTVQIFDKTMSAPDVMGELYSHYLPKVDKNVATYRLKIISSMTKDQVDAIRGDYERDKKLGMVNGQPFDKWLNTIGGDSFFRGYSTGQWHPSDYTPEQIKTFGDLGKYLASKFGASKQENP